LPEEGFGFRTVSGSMPLKQRAEAIAAFQKDPPTTVFLLSMRSGAVGINLTSATHVFLVEPALNPALTEQAIGRSWRMGQRNEVCVKHLIVKNSVESNIVKLLKARAAQAPEGEDEAARERAAASTSNMTKGEVAGHLKADRQRLRAGELDLLFSLDGKSASAGTAGEGAGKGKKRARR
jgi:superfamily II DNA or RNA helicase